MVFADFGGMKVKSIFIALSLPTLFACLLLSITPLRRAIAQTKPGAETPGRQLKRSSEIKALPSKNKRWALVIGVDDYTDPTITKLTGAANDARTLADALSKYAGFPEDQVTLLSSDQPSQLQPRRSTILRYLSNLRANVPKDGLLLVSFAGHGLERSGNAFLLPSDAIGVNDMSLLEDTSIGVERIKASIKGTGVSQVILILDACRTDPAPGRSGGDNLMTDDFRRNFKFDERNQEIEAFATLYATSVGERAYEYDLKRQGYFTWALVEGMRGAAANAQGQVTLQRLVDYLHDSVPKLVQRDLGGDKRQRPFAIIEGYRASDLVIAVGTTGASGPTDVIASSGISEAAKEQALWDAVKEGDDPQDYRDYLEKYPNGAYAAAAQVKLRRLLVAKGNATSAQPASTPGSVTGDSRVTASEVEKANPDKSRITHNVRIRLNVGGGILRYAQGGELARSVIFQNGLAAFSGLTDGDYNIEIIPQDASYRPKKTSLRVSGDTQAGFILARLEPAAFLGAIAGDWTLPSGWTFASGRILIHGRGTALPSDDNYRDYKDFQLSTDVRMMNGIAASFAVRLIDSQNYYLIQITGPNADEPYVLRGFIVRNGVAQRFGTVPIQQFSQTLKPGKFFRIVLAMNDAEIRVNMWDSETGDFLRLGLLLDSSRTFLNGAVGIAARDGEQSEVGQFAICVPPCAPSGGPTEVTGALESRVVNSQSPYGPVAGATVQIINLDTQVQTATKTDADGHFVSGALQPGRYKLIVKAENFKDYVSQKAQRIDIMITHRTFPLPISLDPR